DHCPGACRNAPPPPANGEPLLPGRHHLPDRQFARSLSLLPGIPIRYRYCCCSAQRQALLYFSPTTPIIIKAAKAMRGQCNGSPYRSEEHTSELQSRENLVCRLLLEKKKKH